MAKPGDVVLFHNPHFNIMTALIHATTKSMWNHAALMVDHDLLVEATANGVTHARLSEKTDELLVIPVPYDDEEDRLSAIAWAEARAGVRYGYLNAFICGLNNVFVGLGFVVKRTDAIICSELVAEALEHAGADFGKDSCQVSPGDLATYFGVPR